MIDDIEGAPSLESQRLPRPEQAAAVFTLTRKSGKGSLVLTDAEILRHTVAYEEIKRLFYLGNPPLHSFKRGQTARMPPPMVEKTKYIDSRSAALSRRLKTIPQYSSVVLLMLDVNGLSASFNAIKPF